MHHQYGQVRAELHAVVPVGHGIHTVEAVGVKAQLPGRHRPVYGVRSTGERRRAQRRDVHALSRVADSRDVAREHHAVGEQVVRKGHRLRALQVGVPGHDGALIGLRHMAERAYDVLDELNSLFALVAQVEAGIQRHLVVAAARGVELFAHVAQPCGELRLHKGVDVLGRGVYFERAAVQVGQDAAQALDELRALVRGDNPALGQHARVGDAALDILPVHALIHADTGVQLVGVLVQRSRAPACPNLLHAPTPNLENHGAGTHPAPFGIL